MLFTVVTNTVCSIYFTYDIPMGFMPDVNESIGLLELLLEVLTPFIGCLLYTSDAADE